MGWKQVDKLDRDVSILSIKGTSNEVDKKKKDPCEYFNRTKYSDGILPIDTYKKEVDEVVTRNLTYDWEWLKKK